MTKESLSNYIPKNYEDLYSYYITPKNSLCNQIIRKLIPYSDEGERESLAHDVFLRCLEHKMIERFDPAKANFGGVIYFVTRTICVNFLTKKGRDPITGLCAGTLEARDDEFERGVFREEGIEQEAMHRGEGQNPEGVIEARDQVIKLVKATEARAKTAKNKRDENLITVVKLLFEGYTDDEIAEKTGVTKGTVSNWKTALKEDYGPGRKWKGMKPPWHREAL